MYMEIICDIFYFTRRNDGVANIILMRKMLNNNLNLIVKDCGRLLRHNVFSKYFSFYTEESF